MSTEVAEQPRKERPMIDPGWYLDMSNEDYHGSMGYSSSQLKTLVEQTPAHLKHSFSQPHETTDTKELGTAFHTLTLEPEKFDQDVAVIPEFNLRTKQGKADNAAFRNLHAGKAIIKPHQLTKAQAMADSVRNHPVAGILVQDIIVESSIYWWYRSMDPDDDTKYKAVCKVRPDAVSRAHPVVIDLKSANDGSFTGFMRAITRYYYHLSGAMYLEGVNQCKPLLMETGHFAYNKFVFIVVENEAPYLTSVYELSPDDLALGKNLYRHAMRRLHVGKENDWPGFPEEIRMTELPPWAQRMHIV